MLFLGTWRLYCKMVKKIMFANETRLLFLWANVCLYFHENALTGLKTLDPLIIGLGQVKCPATRLDHTK